ncbi:acetate--CoA ligase family protein [Sphingobium sp. DEHP117]|nr:acetate--CoA ligase family protein [Sphingobium sp. DEHP117]
MERSAIDRLLRPASVAVIGASDKPGALGTSVLNNLDRNGFGGAIYPVNPNRSELGGRACFASAGDLPHGVDCAVLAVPRPSVVETLIALAARDVGATIIFAAGFAEDGEAGLADQRRITEIAVASGMVVEGPNCLGSVNYVDRVPLTFVETDCVAPTGPGIAVVSQSGAMAAVLTTTLRARNLDVSYSVSTGNEAASGVEDYLEWLVDDPHTCVVAMIVEQFRRPAAFLNAVAKLRNVGKTIVLLHPGRSAAARQSAATHTGALAGDYPLMRAVVGHAGVIFAETLEELGDIVEIVRRCPPLAGRSVAVLGESGTFKALTLDLAEEVGLSLTPLSDADSPALREALPPFVPVSNPLDITAMGLSQPKIYTDSIGALLSDDRVGAVLAGIIQTDAQTCALKFPSILAAIQAGALVKPFVYAGLDEGAPVPAEWLERLRHGGVPCFPSADRAVRALARLARALGRRPGGSIAKKPIAGLADLSGSVPEYRAKALLAGAGLSFLPSRLCRSPDEAITAAEELGGAVALKAQSTRLGHKSDAGGVRLNLTGADAIRTAWKEMIASVRAYDPAVELDGILVEAMGRKGIEMILGGRRDPEWGAVVMLGFGGVAAEVLRDVTLVLPGQDRTAICAAIDSLAQAQLLKGFRGAPPADVDALIDLVEILGAVLAGNPRIAEIDLNPVMLLPAGEGAQILDALIELTD